MKPPDLEIQSARLVIARATLEDLNRVISDIEEFILKSTTPSVDDSYINRAQTVIASIAAFSPQLWSYSDLSRTPRDLRGQLGTVRDKVKAFIRSQPASIPSPPIVVDLVESGPAIRPMIKRTVQGDNSSPFRRGSILTLFLASSVGAIGSLLSLLWQPHPTIDYKAQIESLDRTKSAIESVVTFIDTQKKQLQLSQSTVEDLQKQQTDLNTVVSLSSKQVDALLAVQERRNQAAQSHQMWIGLWLGVLSSIGAAMIVGLAVFVYKSYLKPVFVKDERELEGQESVRK